MFLWHSFLSLVLFYYAAEIQKKILKLFFVRRELGQIRICPSLEENCTENWKIFCIKINQICVYFMGFRQLYTKLVKKNWKATVKVVKTHTLITLLGQILPCPSSMFFLLIDWVWLYAIRHNVDCQKDQKSVF